MLSSGGQLYILSIEYSFKDLLYSIPYFLINLTLHIM